MSALVEPLQRAGNRKGEEQAEQSEDGALDGVETRHRLGAGLVDVALPETPAIGEEAERAEQEARGDGERKELEGHAHPKLPRRNVRIAEG